ncbi:hypothetical protein ACJJTC_004657 [Scirpophaga incertulas]
MTITNEVEALLLLGLIIIYIPININIISLSLTLCNKFGLRNSKKLRTHSVQEVVANENVEIRVDTRIKTDIKIQHNRPDIFVYDKKRKEITLIEVGITNLDLLTQVENEKSRKYDLIANELSLIYKCKVKIIPYVITWDGLVTKYHKKYRKEIGIQPKTEAYIQSLVLKKTLESFSFERRRGLEEYTMKLRHWLVRSMRCQLVVVPSLLNNKRQFVFKP